MRFLTIFLLSSLLLACGSPTSTEAPASDASGIVAPETTEKKEEIKPADEVTSRGLETPEVVEEGEDAQLAAIRKDYVRIEAAFKAGTLRKDSISYDCPYGTGGQVDLYAEDGGIVLVIHEFYQGDHSGSTAYYYFRDGAPIFLFKESGVWQFGGEMQTLEDGTEAPGTIDNFTEERMYFHDGRTIKALTKAYEIRNGEELDPDTVPNKAMAHNGELPESLSFIQSVIATGKVDCELVE
ncbi:MAG: hypothetical protein AB8H12_09230 [Lewinella sp.]